MTKCYLFNAQSIVNKLSELQYLLYVDNCECLFITESWLHTDISNGLIDPNGQFTVIRKDRSWGRCALIKRQYSVIPITFAAKYEHLEIIGFDIVNSCPKLRVFVIYRPPHYSSQEATHNEMLIRCLYEHRNIRYYHVMGDFNLPKIDWNTMCCPNDRVSKPFLNLFVVCVYSQLVNFSTRGNKVLDFILTDDDLLIHNIEPAHQLAAVTTFV